MFQFSFHAKIVQVDEKLPLIGIISINPFSKASWRKQITITHRIISTFCPSRLLFDLQLTQHRSLKAFKDFIKFIT
jgi:hypothetical protein